MADTISPKKDDNAEDTDIGSREGSSYRGTLSKEACDMIFAFKAKAIAEDKRKRLIKATLNALEKQISEGNIRES